MNFDVQLTFGDLLSLLLAIVLVFVMGLVAQWILGVHRGFWRAFVSGLIGWGAGVALSNAIFQDVDSVDDLWRTGAASLGFSLLATMLAGIVIDVIVRPRDQRSRRLLRIYHPVRAVRRRMEIAGRIREIVGAARARGLIGRSITPSALGRPDNALKLRQTLEDCGGMFVKFGQIASTRSDLLPPALIDELSNLRSEVRPLPPEVVATVILDGLGMPEAEAFQSFEQEPLAAASIGQIHRARRHDGKAVVVKVQRPAVPESVRRDAAVLRWAARTVERRSDNARRIGVRGFADELIDGLEEELDFTREAANGLLLQRACERIEGVEAPTVFDDQTTRTVLVMEEVQGRPVSDLDALDRSPVPRHELARRLLRAFLDQVLSGGIYHADPHPGNVLLDESGTLWWIDFGSVGFLDPVTLDALQTLALGISLRDPALLTRAVRRMSGEAGDAVDARALEFDLGAVLTDQLRGGGFDPRSISTVLSVMTRYGLRPPRSLTLLSRAMLTLEGTLRLIDPPFALAEEARASLSSMPMTDVGDLNRQLQREAIRALPSLRSLPENVEELALQLRTGRLVIGVDRYSGPDGDRVETWLDRLVFASLGGAGLLSSALLLLGSAVTPDQTTAIVLRWVGFLGLVVSSTMQMRAVAQLLRRRRGDLNRV